MTALLDWTSFAWLANHWTCLINCRPFFSLEKFFAVEVADVLFPTLRHFDGLGGISSHQSSGGGGAPCGADVALIHMSAKINIVGVMWQASQRRV